MMGQRFDSGFWDWTGRSRSACDSQTPTSFLGAHSRAAVDPSDPALHPLAVVGQVLPWLYHDLFIVRNLTQKRPKIFHLNSVPRQSGGHECNHEHS